MTNKANTNKMNVTSCALAVIYPFIKNITPIVIKKEIILFFDNLQFTKNTESPNIQAKIAVVT